MPRLVGTHSEETAAPSTKTSPIEEAVLTRRLVPEEANHFVNAKLKVGTDGCPLPRGWVADVAGDEEEAVAGGIDGESGLETFGIPIAGAGSFFFEQKRVTPPFSFIETRY
jgi:hypothetical protein